MILPNPDRLNRFNKYALVMLVAKRAKQLQEQGIARRALVRSSSQNPLTIALEEVAVGRLVPSFHPEPLPELMEPEPPEAVLITHEFEEVMAKMAAETEHLHASEGAEALDGSREASPEESNLPDEVLLDDAEELLSTGAGQGSDLEDIESAEEGLDDDVAHEAFSSEEQDVEDSSDE